MVNFKIFGIDFGISICFAGILTFMLYVDRTSLMITTLLGVIIHEAGHIALLLIFGCKIQRISFRFGTLSVDGKYSLSYSKEAIMLLGGSLLNFVCSVILYFVYLRYENIYILNLSLVMFVIGFINILPVKGLDGGDLLGLLLFKIFSYKTASVFFKTVEIITCLGIISGGIFIFLKTKSNPTLILFGIYLVICHFR